MKGIKCLETKISMDTRLGALQCVYVYCARMRERENMGESKFNLIKILFRKTDTLKPFIRNFVIKYK